MPQKPKAHRAPGQPTHQERRRSFDKRRAKVKPWRAWYNDPDYRAMRLRVFKRDGYRCQISGVLCVGVGNMPNAPVADHIKEHNGDPVLFWDQDNIQTLAKSVHDSIKQRQENAARRADNIDVDNT